MAYLADFSIHSKNGNALFNYLEYCEDYLWHPSERLKITGGPQDIVIQHYPTEYQAGNGFVIIGGKCYTWEHLKPTLKSLSFAAKYKAFLAKSETKWRLKAQEFAACVLLLFEIARRKNGDQYGGVPFLSRNETCHAIEKALNNGLEDDLIQVFTANSDWENKVQMRRNAYDRITNHETSIYDEMTS